MTEVIVPSPDGGKKKKIFLFFVCVLVLFGCGLLYFYIVSVRNLREASIEKQGFIPVPTGPIEEISPWSETSDMVLDDPPLPTQEDLDTLYRRVSQSIIERDYDGFKNLASSELVWNIDHPKVLLGETAEGLIVWESRGLTGEENFNLHAPYSTRNKAPPIEDIDPTKVEEVASSKEPDGYLLDNTQGKTFLVRDAPWKYRVMLYYALKSYNGDTGSGKVVFVYDQDHWAYDGEWWEIVPHGSARTAGDSENTGATSRTIAIDQKTGRCTPVTLTVRSGDRLVWKNITGMIYSVSPSPQYWQSPYLYNDSYGKNMNVIGSFAYVVQGLQKPDRDVYICRVVVE